MAADQSVRWRSFRNDRHFSVQVPAQVSRVVTDGPPPICGCCHGPEQQPFGGARFCEAHVLRERRGKLAYLEKHDALWQTLAAIAADEGLLLYDAERVGDNLLRVTIARPADAPLQAAKEGGVLEAAAEARHEKPERVTSADCTEVCRRLMVYFYAEGAKFGLRPDVQIEVSSPGVNRELRLPEHFSGAIGERVKLVVYTERDSNTRNGTNKDVSKPIIGSLRSFEQGVLTVLDADSNQAVDVPLSAVKRARVDFKF